MVEKYNYQKWLDSQQKNKRGKIRDDSCLLRFADDVSISSYDGDDTYGYCINYFFWSDEPSRRRARIKCCFFTILVCQEGVKLLSFKSSKGFCLDEILQKMVDIVIAIKDSLNEFKFIPQNALFWNDKPLTPNYVDALWYFDKHNDKKPVKVENVEEYIKEKRLEMEQDRLAREEKT